MPLLTLAALSALAMAAPAAAQQDSDISGGLAGITNRIAQLDIRLQAGLKAGVVTRQKAAGLRQQLRDLKDLSRRYSAGGLTDQERTVLNQRIHSVRQAMDTADGGRFDQDKE